MTSEQKNVLNWMTSFKQNCPKNPILLAENDAKLRARIILEEALETICKGLGLTVTIAADPYGCENLWDHCVEINETNLKSADFSFKKVKEVDLIELADGLADLHYVGYCGTGVAAGLDMEPIFAEVCRSNDTKAWTPEEKDEYQGDDLSFELVETTNERFYVVKDRGGKIKKSPSYSCADIGAIVEEQQSKE